MVNKFAQNFTMRGIFWVIGLLLVGGTVYLGVKPISHKVVLPVEGEIFLLGKHLTNPQSVAQWLHPFAQDGTTKLQDTAGGVLVLSNATAKATATHKQLLSNEVLYDDKYPVTFSIVAAPDTQQHMIQVQYRSSRLSAWFNKKNAFRWAEKSAQEFKAFLEDTRRLYGYEIKLTRVEDTAFLFTSSFCHKKDLTQEGNKLYEKLIAYSEINNGGYYGVRIFFKQPQDSVQYKIFAAIAVTKNFENNLVPGIEFKRMPYQKNLMMASYAGEYGQIHRVYEAMEQFKRDQGLASMAIPFEKIPDGPVLLNDKDLVKRDLFYPIF